MKTTIKLMKKAESLTELVWGHYLTNERGNPAVSQKVKDATLARHERLTRLAAYLRSRLSR